MKAAFIRRTGPPDVIEFDDLPVPAPGPNDVLVRLHAAAVDPVDTYIRQGLVAMDLTFPFIVGRDLAGTVEAVGSAVRGFAVGDRAWCNNQGIDGRQGSFAEFSAVAEDLLYPLPASVGFEDMMALAHAGLTACLGIERMGGLAPGQVVYVNGGAGNVGRALVQVATGLGARVIATAGTPAGRDTCRADGAIAALDYRSPALADDLRAAAPDGIDVYWDLSGRQDLGFALAHLRRRGRIVVMSGLGARPVLPVGALYVNDVSIVGFAITYATVAEMRAAAERINALAGAGRLRGAIARRLPLSQAREAHRLIEDKSVRLDGKIVVVPD
jgi:NADPH:quinone reductase-like Zn-dependent oxidoreductase